jgi:hypothetical protein
MMGVRQVRRGAARGGGSEEQQERLPQNLVPVPGREDALGNEGSGKFLGWHCDGGFDRDGLQEADLGDYLMLFGVHGKRGAPTLCCNSIMAVEALSAADQRLLRTEGFTFDLTQTGEGKGSDQGGEGEGKPVVRDHPDTGLPQVRTIEFAPSATEEALGAYQRLQAASKLTCNPPFLVSYSSSLTDCFGCISAVAKSVGFGVELGLDGNDCLLLNNRNAVRGRFAFEASYASTQGIHRCVALVCSRWVYPERMLVVAGRQRPLAATPRCVSVYPDDVR